MAEGSNPPSGPTQSPGDDLESTRALVERARGGDAAALDRLFSRLRPPLQRWASGRLPRWARELVDTDDLVQDSLLQTLRKVGTFEPRHPGALQAYLRQAVLNRLRDTLRRKQRQPPSMDLDAVQLAAEGSPLEAAIGREEAVLYETALGRLSPDDREAIIARIELGYDYAELAEALGRPTPDAARKAVQRAVVRLAEEIRRARG